MGFSLGNSMDHDQGSVTGVLQLCRNLVITTELIRKPCARGLIPLRLLIQEYHWGIKSLALQCSSQ